MCLSGVCLSGVCLSVVCASVVCPLERDAGRRGVACRVSRVGGCTRVPGGYPWLAPPLQLCDCVLAVVGAVEVLRQALSHESQMSQHGPWSMTA